MSKGEPSKPAKPAQSSGIAALADQFDAFVLDPTLAAGTLAGEIVETSAQREARIRRNAEIAASDAEFAARLAAEGGAQAAQGAAPAAGSERYAEVVDAMERAGLDGEVSADMTDEEFARSLQAREDALAAQSRRDEALAREFAADTSGALKEARTKQLAPRSQGSGRGGDSSGEEC